jgi:hypothetical protein
MCLEAMSAVSWRGGDEVDVDVDAVKEGEEEEEEQQRRQRGCLRQHNQNQFTVQHVSHQHQHH